MSRSGSRNCGAVVNPPRASLLQFLFRCSREAVPYTSSSISFSARPLRPRDSRLFGRPLRSCTFLVSSFHTSACRACDTRRSPCSPRPCQRCLPEAPAERLRTLARVGSREPRPEVCWRACSREQLVRLLRWNFLNCFCSELPRCQHPSSLLSVWRRSSRSWSDHSSVAWFARERLRNRQGAARQRAKRCRDSWRFSFCVYPSVCGG
jgi:hypothetical protein